MSEPKKEDIFLTTFLWLLMISAFTTDLAFKGSVSVNLSHGFGIVLLILLIIYHAINSRQIVLLYKDAHAIFIYLYFFSNLLSSLLFSPVIDQSLKGCLLILSYVIIYITARWAVIYIYDRKEVVRKLMGFNTLSAVFGLTCMVVSLVQGRKENIGVSLAHLGTSGIRGIEANLPSIKSLSVEPNLFAIITATILCINLSVYLLWQKSGKRLFIIGLLTLSVLFSYTRSVYFSLFVALFVLIVASRRVKLLLTMFNYFILIVIILAVTMISLPDENDIKKVLVTRTATLFDFEQGSGRGRVEGFLIAWEGFRDNPVLGNGTLSANTRFYNPWRDVFQERMGSPGWLNGVFMQSLHDTGLLGVLIIIGLFTSVLIANYRVFKQLDNASIEKSIILGFLAGNTILFITSQISSTLWVSFPYIYWGINMGFISWCRKRLHGTS